MTDVTETPKPVYHTELVAETNGLLNEELFEKVIALRDKTYNNDPELESVEAIRLRLAGTNLKNDPVKLQMNAIVDDAKNVVGFSILETYLDRRGKELSGCMTYANADPEFAHSPGGKKALFTLHQHTVGGRPYPIIVEVNPGDTKVIDNRIQKHMHPFDFRNNNDPLVVEMAIKLGVDPGRIDKKLIPLLVKQASGNGMSKSELKDMIGKGQLRDKLHGNIISAIVPIRYNALNLGSDAKKDDPFYEGPENLHIAIVNLPNGVDFNQAELALCNLQESILAGNHKKTVAKEEAARNLKDQQPQKDMIEELGRVQELHGQAHIRAGRVGPKGSGERSR